jgi:hypothetical protein
MGAWFGPGRPKGPRGDDMETVANYIIRIYRCEKDRPKSLVGVVSEAGKSEKKVFQSYDELWEILNSEKSKGKNGPAGETPALRKKLKLPRFS